MGRFIDPDEEVEPVWREMASFLASLGVGQEDLGAKRYGHPAPRAPLRRGRLICIYIRAPIY